VCTKQFFGSSLTESDRTAIAGVTFQSSSAQFAAIALYIDSGMLTTLPVERLQ
jgi:hypothetical protein